MLDQILALAERVCWRARKRHMRARTVTLKLRYTDFKTLTRSRTGPPTDEEALVLERLQALYEKAKTRPVPVRLVGVALSNLVTSAGQLTLPFTRRRRVGDALDRVRLKYGYDAVRLGASSAQRRDAARRRRDIG